MKNTLNYNQMQMLKKEKSEFKKIKHDYINIITTAKGFIEIGKPEKAYEFLNNTGDNLLGLAGFFICSNETLNTILYIKSREAENEGTKLNIQIKDEYAIMINDYDLCRLVSNIIDNSINATRNAKDKSQISISIEIDEKTLKINSKNKFSNKTNDHKKQRSRKRNRHH